MTLPPSDAQSSRLLPRRPQLHSVPPTPTAASALSLPVRLPVTPQATTSPSSLSPTEFSDEIDHDRAIDFASHSWDLATGGLKTLTAKRELPSLLERRPTEQSLGTPDTGSAPRSYTFLLIILICLVIMLISGSIVLFVMMQP